MRHTSPLNRARRTAFSTPSLTEPVVEKADCGYMGSTTNSVQPASFSSFTTRLICGFP